MAERATRFWMPALAVLGAGAIAGVLAIRGYCAPFSPAPPRDNLPLDRLKLPEGFHISVYASAPGARSMTLSPNGILYIGSREEGNVYAAVDRKKQGKADEVVAIARGLNMPNGVAWKDGSLYVAEIHRVIRFDKIDDSLQNPPRPVVVNDSFPKDKHHGWKFIRFGPDGKLYVPVGAPCNVCLPDSDIYMTIARMNPDGSGLEIFARGIRNTVGFDWDPATKELWFTDNGRDWLGDNMPSDELNRAPKMGMHFGFPFCHANSISDPEFGKLRRCDEFSPPALELGAHVASLGMRFYTGAMFPEKYRGGIFIAEHGSWNRSVADGYRVVFVPVSNGKAGAWEMFAQGWLGGNKAWGRPVDVQVMPDGALLVSDDKAGVIYRISYSD